MREKWLKESEVQVGLEWKEALMQRSLRSLREENSSRETGQLAEKRKALKEREERDRKRREYQKKYIQAKRKQSKEKAQETREKERKIKARWRN